MSGVDARAAPRPALLSSSLNMGYSSVGKAAKRLQSRQFENRYEETHCGFAQAPLATTEGGVAAKFFFFLFSPVWGLRMH